MIAALNSKFLKQSATDAFSAISKQTTSNKIALVAAVMILGAASLGALYWQTNRTLNNRISPEDKAILCTLLRRYKEAATILTQNTDRSKLQDFIHTGLYDQITALLRLRLVCLPVQFSQENIPLGSSILIHNRTPYLVIKSPHNTIYLGVEKADDNLYLSTWKLKSDETAVLGTRVFSSSGTSFPEELQKIYDVMNGTPVEERHASVSDLFADSTEPSPFDDL